MNWNSLIPYFDGKVQKYFWEEVQEGERNSTLYHVAQQLFWANCPMEEAMDLLMPRTTLDHDEAERTIISAYNSRKGSPPNKLLNYLSQHEPSLLQLPPPISNQEMEFLKVAYRPGDNICISPLVNGKPNGSSIIGYEECLKRLQNGHGWPVASLEGAYVKVNPTSGLSDKDVTAYRHVMIESDKAPLLEQYAWFVQSSLPISCLIFSGNRSIHAWVRVDAKDDQEYKERVEQVYRSLPTHFDCHNKNAGRYSRLPGVCGQQLIGIGLGSSSYDQWSYQFEDPDLPALKGVDWIRGECKEPQEIIPPFLHRGSKMVIGGPSKARKTFLMLQMALSVATGRTWLGYEMRGPSRVLYVNLEIGEPFFHRRIHTIAGALGFDPCEVRDNLYVWNLRGYSKDATIMSEIIRKKAIKMRDVDLIVIDPIYKILGNRDENSASDMTNMLNTLEAVAVQCDAAIVFAAHFAKGNSDEKASIDRVSGSGVFARDPDALMMMNPVKDEVGKYRCTWHTRNCAPIPDQVIAWDDRGCFETIIMQQDRVRELQARDTSAKLREMMFATLPLDGTGIVSAEWYSKLKAKRVSRIQFVQALNKLLEGGLVERVSNGVFRRSDNAGLKV